MSTILMSDRLPSEVGDSDTYNRLQVRRAIQTRGDPKVDPTLGACGESLRVLIVDDHRATADTMAMLVSTWGHDFRRAYDATTGLALAAAYQPDVLLLDIMMPTVTGLEVAALVRRQDSLQNCLIVAITGRADETSRLRCVEAGVDLFLIKPVTPSILKTLLVWESEYKLRSRGNVALYRSHVQSARQFEEPQRASADTTAYPLLQEPFAHKQTRVYRQTDFSNRTWRSTHFLEGDLQ